MYYILTNEKLACKYFIDLIYELPQIYYGKREQKKDVNEKQQIVLIKSVVYFLFLYNPQCIHILLVAVDDTTCVIIIEWVHYELVRRKKNR